MLKPSAVISRTECVKMQNAKCKERHDQKKNKGQLSWVDTANIDIGHVSEVLVGSLEPIRHGIRHSTRVKVCTSLLRSRRSDPVAPVWRISGKLMGL